MQTCCSHKKIVFFNNLSKKIYIPTPSERSNSPIHSIYTRLQILLGDLYSGNVLSSNISVEDKIRVEFFKKRAEATGAITLPGGKEYVRSSDIKYRNLHDFDNRLNVYRDNISIHSAMELHHPDIDAENNIDEDDNIVYAADDDDSVLNYDLEYVHMLSDKSKKKFYKRILNDPDLSAEKNDWL